LFEAVSLIFQTPSEKSPPAPPRKETPHLTQIHYAGPFPDSAGKILEASLDQPYVFVGVAIAGKDGPKNRNDVFASPLR